MFEDRKDAGKQLATRLKKFKNENPIVLAIPRGGVVTAYEAIKKFNFQWDLIIPRKISSPINEEIAIGAVSLDEICLVNENYISMLNISKEYIEKEVFKQTEEIKSRLNKYKGNHNFPHVKNKTVIIIDDGIATGFTIQAAINSIKKHDAKKIILAVPVAPPDTIYLLKEMVDEIICLIIPDRFYSVGSYYKNFEQTTDEEIFHILNELKNSRDKI